MRRKDRAFTLACLDQPEVLRQVLGTFCENGLVAKCRRERDARVVRPCAWSRAQARTTSTRDSTYCDVDDANVISEPDAYHCRTTLHVRCANEERHALLETRSWSSALLATQRREGDAAPREAHH